MHTRLFFPFVGGSVSIFPSKNAVSRFLGNRRRYMHTRLFFLLPAQQPGNKANLLHHLLCKVTASGAVD